MQITFHKYHGCGNDFIIIDDRQNQFVLNDVQIIKGLCDRHFGIGADGLILLRNYQYYDFEMIYYNSDGSTSGLCGNGARCIVNFAKSLGIIEQKARFVTNGKEYFADIIEDNVRLYVQDPIIKEINYDYAVINTGSNHIVIQTDDIQNVDINKKGYDINQSEKHKQTGINVNYYQQIGDKVHLRTYERGVGQETLACGTGAIATAVALCISNKLYGKQRIDIITKGGSLIIGLENNENSITNVTLEGPGKFVYIGQINL